MARCLADQAKMVSALSDAGAEAVRLQFAAKHQVEGANRADAEDARELLQRAAAAHDAERAGGTAFEGACSGLPADLMDNVVAAHRVMYLEKVKDGAAAKVAQFRRMDQAALAAETEGRAVPRDDVAAMVALISGNIRPVMIPGGLLRPLHRLRVRRRQAETRKAFEGWQYGAGVPGGAECLIWMSRLCWDKGIPYLMGDVPGGFPGAFLSKCLVAMREPAVSSIARLREWWGRRPELGWAVRLVGGALGGLERRLAGGTPAAGGGDAGGGELAAKRAAAGAAANAAARVASEEDAAAPAGSGQTVGQATSAGWAACVRWRAEVVRLDAFQRKRHERPTARRAKRPGSDEVEEERLEIPASFAEMRLSLIETALVAEQQCESE
eukprot:g4068.t1